MTGVQTCALPISGRKALFNEGRVEVGPYQSPMEDGMQHFHEWYRRKLGGELGPTLNDGAR